ncbi:MAG TPA: hypothetical protein VFD39_07100 [Trueperaceae bacterium]|nr:hypothetical protein [Trueperaceae bacterium]
MSDAIDHEGLYRLAEEQAGYFTTQQAIDVGMDDSTLSHHARDGGRFERINTGLYRLRHFPTSQHEHVVAAWLPLRAGGGVVSHESALELYELSDVIPRAVHITLPRSKRGNRRRTGVQLHALEQPPGPKEVRRIGPVVATTPERSIVDALASGSQPEQIELAIQQALDRGLTTPERLRRAATERSRRVREQLCQFLVGQGT